jgi:hypothetical protein
MFNNSQGSAALQAPVTQPFRAAECLILSNDALMLPIQRFSSGVLAEIVRRQPGSPARTSFAWQLAVGPALARVTSVSLDGTTLQVRAADGRWLGEIERARGTILPKIQALLGNDHVTKITTR